MVRYFLSISPAGEYWKNLFLFKLIGIDLSYMEITIIDCCYKCTECTKIFDDVVHPHATHDSAATRAGAQHFQINVMLCILQKEIRNDLETFAIRLMRIFFYSCESDSPDSPE